MKRSEMLEILEDAMLNHYDWCYHGGATYDYDGILAELEKAGMVPPSNMQKQDQGMVKVNKWEPENDLSLDDILDAKHLLETGKVRK